jgi:hypothetical protein
MAVMGGGNFWYRYYGAICRILLELGVSERECIRHLSDFTGTRRFWKWMLATFGTKAFD